MVELGAKETGEASDANQVALSLDADNVVAR